MQVAQLFMKVPKNPRFIASDKYSWWAWGDDRRCSWRRL